MNFRHTLALICILAAASCASEAAQRELQVRAVFHRKPGWYEETTLTLLRDGRFMDETQSDVGGLRSPEWGSYYETSNSLTLQPDRQAYRSGMRRYLKQSTHGREVLHWADEPATAPARSGGRYDFVQVVP
jgi:hypothetical protein